MDMEIIKQVLSVHSHSNLSSGAARKVIAEEIIKAHASKIEPRRHRNMVLPE
jgi:hypothetical protein|tara:strand:+ start:2937 stop:3092 length:156 start_codon:yes stop_codon:yes gene_type:complete